MTEADDWAPLPLGRQVPPTFNTRVVTIPARASHPFDPTEWADSIIILERGTIELHCVNGGRYPFARGAILCLDGLQLRHLHNPGPDPAILLAVSRKRP